MTDIYYVLRKYIPESYRRRDFISIILDGFEVIPVDKGILKSALESEIPDYEDAVIDTCAERYGTYAIITNDKSGFQKGKVKVLLPKEAVAEFGL